MYSGEELRNISVGTIHVSLNNWKSILHIDRTFSSKKVCDQVLGTRVDTHAKMYKYIIATQN